MTILRAFGVFVVRAASTYNYDAEWRVLPGHEHVTKLTDDTGEAFIRKQKAMLLFFYSRTCPHCAKVKPQYANSAKELAMQGSSVQLAAIEFGLYPGLASKYGIKKVPAIYYFRNGRLQQEYTEGNTTSQFVAYALKLKV